MELNLYRELKYNPDWKYKGKTVKIGWGYGFGYNLGDGVYFNSWNAVETARGSAYGLPNTVTFPETYTE